MEHGNATYTQTKIYSFDQKHQAVNSAARETKLPVQDGRVEGCALISSYESNKFTTSCWTIMDRRILEKLPKRSLHFQRQASARWRDTITIKSNPISTRWVTHRLRTITTKEFFHCREGSEPHIRLPSLGIWQRDWESPGNLTLKASGIY